ncbi:hypothetical protein [Streptomyces iconiensis]|uniref:2-polyprenyl-6-methoxyphenol hydroxylase n=1 Tax=Streptomyces iconiensis TaxID=1384038 RepID=A0ABT6ZTL1_9ACTN|nr:hypothetical protein [Streptomyces iconiensis]MDJ1132398.1 hypothetical protein [Streptomyces iconiensis]
MGHAVVLGAGMAGLCAARAAAGHFEKVTVVERDRLPPDATARRGIPQGRHVHALLGTGAHALERLFPGLAGELVASGAVRSELLAEARYVLGDLPLARGDARVTSLQATRPLLEAGIRERVRALPGVTFLEGYDVLDPVIEGRAVTGVRVQRRAGGGQRTKPGAAESAAGSGADPHVGPGGTEPEVEPGGTGPGGEPAGNEPEVLPAALVVDAMGRAGRAAGWLAAGGYEAPPEERTDIDVGYATRFLMLTNGALGGDKTVLTGNFPAHPGRGCALFLQEDKRWILTLAGMGGDHPPIDEEGFRAFARTALPAALYDVVRGAEVLGTPVFHRFPYSVRRRFERLESYPDGLVAAGDSVCSFNPVYGQGMSVAAREAEVLDTCLRGALPDLPRRYFAQIVKVVGPAWDLARSADLSVPGVGARRTLGTRIVSRYMQRLLTSAQRDPELAALYVRVIGLLDPPSRMLAPRVVRAVVRGGG